MNKAEELSWKLAVRTEIVSVYRSGWAGVLDALISAITRNKRYIIQRPITFSCWVKADEWLISTIEVNCE